MAMPTTDQQYQTVTSNDLELAFKTIHDKRTLLDLLFAYAEGPQPLQYTATRLTDTFQNINTHFELNWCSIIVDATLDRIQLTGFDVKDKASNDKIALLFDKLHLDLEANQAHYASLVTGQSYIIVWQDEELGPVAYFNDPRLCAVFYDPARPRVKSFAAKWFQQLDGSHEITLYYKDRIEHWTCPKSSTASGGLDKASGFTLESQESNTFGVIPVFELRSPGELQSKITYLQDAVNKLLSDMMISAEFGAFVQRYVISQGDPGNLRNKPNEIWWIPAGDGAGQQSQVGQFSQTSLDVFEGAIDNLSNAMAIISRTPKHYFMATGANISGEALLAMEAPLNKKCEKRQEEFAAQWQEIAQFLIQLDGIKKEAFEIEVMWDGVESVQPLTEAQTLQTNVNAGIPLVTALKDQGWSEEEIEKMQEDKAAQQANERSLAQATLDKLRLAQASQNPNDVNAPAV